MKKSISKTEIILIIILLFAVLSCERRDIFSEFISDEYLLTYMIESEEPLNLQVIYKAGDKYLTEETVTPFIYEQTVNLDECINNAFEYFVQTKFINPSDWGEKLSGFIYVNEKLIDSIEIVPGESSLLLNGEFGEL